MPVLIRAQHALAPLRILSRGSSALADDLRELLGPSLVSCTPRVSFRCARIPQVVLEQAARRWRAWWARTARLEARGVRGGCGVVTAGRWAACVYAVNVK